jgi:hypothetical protein
MLESEGRQRAQRRVEDKQVQAEPTIQTLRSDVQTQTPDRNHHLAHLLHKDQTKQPHKRAAAQFLEAVSGKDKEGEVESSVHILTPNRNDLVPSLSRPDVALRSPTKVRSLNSKNGTVPNTLSTDTQANLAIPQSPLPTNRYISFEEATNIQNSAIPDSVGGASHATLESVYQPVSVEELIRESECTRRMIALDDKVFHEATERRRENMMFELNKKFRKWDIKHKEFMKRIEREDSEQLNRILLRKSTEPVPPFNDVIRSELVADHAPIIVEQQDSSATDSLLHSQVSIYFNAINTVVGWNH